MELQKRFYIALAIYAVLALLVWKTMSDVPIPVGNGSVSIRGLTWAILAFFAVRTFLHWRAEQIRAEREQNQGLES